MKKFLLAAILILTAIFAGCGDEKATENDNTLKVMLGANPVSLDHSQATDSESFELIADCIDGLMQLDAKGAAIPAIAESYDVSEDGKTYTFHLRDAKWANGEDVTAADFVFAWRRHCVESTKYAYIMGATVACIKNADAVTKKSAAPETLGVTAKDAKTLVVELDAPVSFFPALMVFPAFYPINEAFYNKLEKGSYGTSPETFLSNGAFKLADYVPGAASIKLVKNDSYWNAANVSLENLSYQVVTSSDNALTAFKNGTLDVVTVGGNQVQSVYSDPELSKNLKIISIGVLNYLTFNQDSKNHHAGALANKNLRLAISNAIDRELLVNNYVTNGSIDTYTAIPVNFAPNAETGKFFAENQQQFSDVIGFDVEKAREFLETAKSELGKDTFDLNIIYANDGSDTIIKIIQAIKAQVEENLPGVTLNLQPMPKAEYLDNVTSNNYDIAITNWSPDYDDPMTFFTLWTTEGCEIAEHWSNADYDKIIEDCTTGALASDYAARWAAMYDAERILLEEAVIAPIYTLADANLISEKGNGVEFHAVAIDRVYKNVK